jgi:hypothetical protein
VETGRRNVYELDPADGACYTLDAAHDEGSLTARLKIEARGARVLWTTDEGAAAKRRQPTARVAGTPVDLVPKGAGRGEHNVLVLDHCELEVDGKSFGPESVYAANHRLWRLHGMDTNGWMAVIQYRDQILARNSTMAPGSGGAVHYRFRVSGDFDTGGIKLGVETPELWEVTINGHPVDLARGERWLDDHIRTAGVGDYLKQGENVVRLEGQPFDVRREVHQIYLLGEFSCAEDHPGFLLEPPRPLGLGAWRRYGCPFYDRDVSYVLELPEGDGMGILALDEQDWNGSLILVEQGERVLAELKEPPYEVRLDASTGSRVALRVIGLPKNLLGPWHDPERSRGRAWIPMWYGPTVPDEPQPGSNYDLLDVGLFGTPRWRSLT